MSIEPRKEALRYECHSALGIMQQAKNGGWVSYADYQKLLKQMDELVRSSSTNISDNMENMFAQLREKLPGIMKDSMVEAGISKDES